MEAKGGAPRPADPRVERSRRVILEAAVAELGRSGYGAFTMEAVAARAGVSKATLYRHWSDRVSLIADAFRTFHAQEGPDLASGSPRERLERIVRHVAEVVRRSPFSECMPALIDGAERDPALRAFHHAFQAEARRPLAAVIAEGAASGEFRAGLDAELAAIALLGAIFFRRLMTDAPFEAHRAAALVETVLGPPPDR